MPNEEHSLPPCDVCGRPAIAFAPGTAPDIVEGFGFAIDAGEAPRAWCREHWPFNRHQEQDMAKPKKGPTPPEDFISLTADTLAGDIRDFLLDRLKHDKSALPWDMQSEEKQRETITQADSAARRLVREVVNILTTRDFPTVVGKLVSAAVKDSIKTQVEFARHDENRLLIFDNIGRQVVLILADPEEFMGERGAVQVRPDQPPLFDEDTPPEEPPAAPDDPPADPGQGDPPPDGDEGDEPPPDDEGDFV